MKPIVDFEAVPFLSINGQTLSLARVLQYFQRAGKLLPLLREIVEQSVIDTEMQCRTDLDVSRAVIDQAIVDFRVQAGLTKQVQFQQWLAGQGLDYAAFQHRIVFNARLEKLVERLAAPQLDDYFEQQRPLLTQVDLSCIVTAEKELAVALHTQLVREEMLLENMLQRYALENREQVKVLRGFIRRGKLTRSLRAAVDAAAVGALVGPIAVDHCWCLFQVGARVPAVLEDDLKQELQKTLFQQWLAARIQPLTVQLAHQGMPQEGVQQERTGSLVPAIAPS